MPITLSVIIPCYNLENYIERCLNSIISQIHDRGIEIIAIDDGSRDNTLDILNKYQSIYPSLRVMSQKNAGPATARNRGVELARGNYIWFIDGDDYIMQGAIELIWPHLNRGYDLITFNYFMKETDGLKKKGPFASYAEIKASRLIEMGSLLACNRILKRELFEKVKYPEGLINIEDLVFNLSVSPFVKTVLTIPDPIYIYERTNIMSTSVNTTKRHLIRKYNETLIAHKILMEKLDTIENKELRESFIKVLNKSFTGCIFSLLRFYNCRFVRNTVKLYEGWGVYPFKYAGNYRMKAFTFMVNHKSLWRAYPLIKGLIPH